MYHKNYYLYKYFIHRKRKMKNRIRNSGMSYIIIEVEYDIDKSNVQ